MKNSETSFSDYLKVICDSFLFQYLFPIIVSTKIDDLFDGAYSI